MESRACRVIWSVLLAVMIASIPVSARTLPSAAVFNDAGALIQKPAAERSLILNDAVRLDPWNLWTRVADGTSQQTQSPDLALGEDGSVNCLYTGTESGWYWRRLLHATSPDQNNSWSNPATEAAQTTGSIYIMHPVYAKVTDEQVWIVYSQDEPSLNGVGIRFVKSIDGGVSFGNPVVVDDGSPAGLYNMDPTAISAGEAVCAAWYEYETGEVRFNRSLDAGATWLADDVHVADTFPGVIHSQVALDYDPTAGILYLAWATIYDQILVVSTDDFGDTFSTPVVANDFAAYYISSPSLSCGASGTIHVVWDDFRNNTDLDIYYARSDDFGATWTRPSVKINDNIIPGNQYEPHLDRGPDGVLHAAFIQNIPFDIDLNLYYTRSLDDGLTWEAPNSRVNDIIDEVQADVPRTADVLGAPAGRAYVAWRDNRGPTTVYCASNMVVTAVGDETVVPSGLEISVQPNPASSSVSIRFGAALAEEALIQIFDVRGRKVAEARSNDSWRWDLRDLQSRPVAQGLYLVRVESGRYRAVESVLIQR